MTISKTIMAIIMVIIQITAYKNNDTIHDDTSIDAKQLCSCSNNHNAVMTVMKTSRRT